MSVSKFKLLIITFTLILTSSFNVEARSRFESVDGCVLEIKYGTTYSLINLKEVDEFMYGEPLTGKFVVKLMLGGQITDEIGILDKEQVKQIKDAYLSCIQ